MTDRAISPLRRRLIEDMTVRGFTPATQRGYLRAVADFTGFFGRPPDQADAEDLRRYQVHMRSQGATATSMNAAVSALRAPGCEEALDLCSDRCAADENAARTRHRDSVKSP